MCYIERERKKRRRGPESEADEARTDRFLGDLSFDLSWFLWKSFGRDMREDEDNDGILESLEEQEGEEANGGASIAAFRN